MKIVTFAVKAVLVAVFLVLLFGMDKTVRIAATAGVLARMAVDLFIGVAKVAVSSFMAGGMK